MYMDFEPLHNGNVAHEAEEDDEADEDDEDDAYEAGEFDDESDLGNSEDTMDDETEMEFGGWEPPLDPHNAQGAEQDSDGGVSDTAADADADARAGKHVGATQFWNDLFIKHYPDKLAGAPVEGTRATNYDNCLHGCDVEWENLWAPFKSKLDWEFARWAKLYGPGSTAVTELLAIEGVSVRLAYDQYVILLALPGCRETRSLLHKCQRPQQPHRSASWMAPFPSQGNSYWW